MHLYGENLRMFIFSITVQAKIIILVRNVKPNATLVYIKYIKLTCDLLSKATHLDRHTPILHRFLRKHWAV